VNRRAGGTLRTRREVSVVRKNWELG